MGVMNRRGLFKALSWLSFGALFTRCVSAAASPIAPQPIDWLGRAYDLLMPGLRCYRTSEVEVSMERDQQNKRLILLAWRHGTEYQRAAIRTIEYDAIIDGQYKSLFAPLLNEMMQEVATPPAVSTSLGIPYPRDVVNMESLRSWIGSWNRKQYDVLFGTGLNDARCLLPKSPSEGNEHYGLGVKRIFDRRDFDRNRVLPLIRDGKTNEPMHPGDASFYNAYRSAIKEAAQQIYTYVLLGQGNVYWREHPEIDIQLMSIMTDIDSSGPYTDLTTNTVGYANHDYGAVKFWCRFSCNKWNQNKMHDVRTSGGKLLPPIEKIWS